METKRRVIIEGVEFAQLFHFPLILNAITAAMQPQRLIIALLTVTALITAGRIWDAVAPRSVSPDGLAAGEWRADIDGPAHQAMLRNAMNAMATAPATNATIEGTNLLDRQRVLKAIEEGYASRRAAATSAEQQQALDRQYVVLVRQIRETQPRGVFEATESHLAQSFRYTIQRLVGLDLAGTVAGLGMMWVQTPVLLWTHFPWFTIIYGLIAITLLAIGGGAIARMAATQIAGSRRLSIRQAFDFAFQHWVRLTVAVVLPLIILLIVRFVIAVMGLLMGAPVLDVIGGLIYGLALILGFLIAFLVIGYLLGSPMLVPAVAVENCEGADAMQRAYAYVVTRPLHLIGYWLVAVVGLAIGFLIVGLFASIMLNSTANLYDRFVDHPAIDMAGGYSAIEFSRQNVEPALLNWHQRIAAALIGFWETLVVSLVAAYVVSYFFSAATALYLLMRRVCDGQEIHEIWKPEAPAPAAALTAIPAPPPAGSPSA